MLLNKTRENQVVNEIESNTHARSLGHLTRLSPVLLNGF